TPSRPSAARSPTCPSWTPRRRDAGSPTCSPTRWQPRGGRPKQRRYGPRTGWPSERSQPRRPLDRGAVSAAGRGGLWTDKRRLAGPAQVLDHEERSDEGRGRTKAAREANHEHSDVGYQPVLAALTAR